MKVHCALGNEVGSDACVFVGERVKARAFLGVSPVSPVLYTSLVWRSGC